MSLRRPATSRILTSMLIAFETTVQPEIQSPRAKFMGFIIAYLMQALILREGGGEASLRTAIPKEREALARAAALLDDARLAAIANEGVADDASVAELNAAHERLSTALEDAVQALLRGGIGGEGDGRKALLDGLMDDEVVFLDAIDPVRLGEGESYTAALQTDDGIPAPALGAYLAAHGPFVGRDVRVTDVTRLMGGFSKDTFIVSLAGADRPADQIVLRRDSPSGPIDTSVADEHPVIAGLFAAGLPVAEPLWLERDRSHFGSPFMLTSKLEGGATIHSDGVTLLVGPEEAKTAAKRFARLLGRMHSMDLRELGYAEDVAARPTADHVRDLVDEFEAYWRPRKPGPEPIMAAAFEWMRGNIPAVLPRAALVHGDASLRNVLIHDGEVSALLDWETVHIGDPSEDIAYIRRDIDLIMPWDEFLAEYYAGGGPEYREENERFFTLWSNVRNGAYSLPHGFEAAAVPDVRFAFSSAYYHRDFLRNIAAFLKEHALTG